MPNPTLFNTTRAAIFLNVIPCFCPRSLNGELHLRDPQQTSYPVKMMTRVLVIDDDACVSTAIQAILVRHDCETVIASRAHAGIHTFQASKFDVVMIDLFMPGMNGLDTIARIRGESAVPIVAMSGFRLRNSLAPDQDFLAMAMLRGATIRLRKPFSRPQLIAAIDQSVGVAPSSRVTKQ